MIVKKRLNETAYLRYEKHKNELMSLTIGAMPENKGEVELVMEKKHLLFLTFTLLKITLCYLPGHTIKALSKWIGEWESNPLNGELELKEKFETSMFDAWRGMDFEGSKFMFRGYPRKYRVIWRNIETGDKGEEQFRNLQEAEERMAKLTSDSIDTDIKLQR